MKILRDFLPTVLVVLGLLAIWEAYVRSGFITTSILPAPSNILHTLLDNRNIIWSHTLQTLAEALVGLAIAVVLGMACGIALFLSSRLRKALYPLLVVTQTIPMIVLAPLLLIWFGFGILPKVIIVVLYCFYPISIAVSGGLSSADEYLVDLMKSMKATRWQMLRYIQIPSALPVFFSGLKISTTYAIAGAIVGEYVGAYKGLGIYMQSAAHMSAINVVFASIFVIVFLSLFLLSAVLLIEKWCLPLKVKSES